MADEPISALAQIAAPPFATAFTNPSTGAMLEILDTTNTTMASTGTNSKVAPGDLLKGYLAAGSNVTLTETAGIVTIAASGGGGLTVGNAISGGTASGLLYENSSSDLGVSSSITTDGNVVTIAQTGGSCGLTIGGSGSGYTGTLQYLTIQAGPSNYANFGIAASAGQFTPQTVQGDAVFKFHALSTLHICDDYNDFIRCVTQSISPYHPKIGFFDVTPVFQPAGGGGNTSMTANTGTAVLAGSTFTGTTGSSTYTIGDIVTALKSLGLLTA